MSTHTENENRRRQARGTLPVAVHVPVLHQAAELLAIASASIEDGHERADLAGMSCRLWSLTRRCEGQDVVVISPIDIGRARNLLTRARELLFADLEIGIEFWHDAGDCLQELPLVEGSARDGARNSA